MRNVLNEGIELGKNNLQNCGENRNELRLGDEACSGQVQESIEFEARVACRSTKDKLPEPKEIDSDYSELCECPPSLTSFGKTVLHAVGGGS